MTTLFIDGDACPVREEAFRVATRLDLPVKVVSNGSRPVRPPGLPNVEMVLVPRAPMPPTTGLPSGRRAAMSA